LFTYENVEDSLIISYLRDSLNAPKSIRVFNKEIAYKTFVAFSQKMNKDERKQVFLEGMMETLDNEQLKQNIKNKINRKKMND
jgi:sRNA-binding carbon storage regulator CsrA